MLIIIYVLTYCTGGSTQTLPFELDPDVPSWDRFFLLLLSNFAYINVPRARVVCRCMCHVPVPCKAM